MNQDEIPKRIKQEIQNIKLTSEEKSHIFKRVMEAPLHSPYVPVKSRLVFVLMKWNYAFVFLAFILVGGISTAYASLESIPGEKLYSVKLKVTEPILDTLSFSNEAKVKREATKALSRLEEAEKLIEKDELTTENRVFLETEFRKHADSFNLKIETSKGVKENDKNDLKFSFDVSLYKYTDNIEKVKSKKENSEGKYDNSKDNQIKNQNQEATFLEKAIQEKVIEHRDDTRFDKNEKTKSKKRKNNFESKKSSVQSIIQIGTDKINKVEVRAEDENLKDDIDEDIEIREKLDRAKELLIEVDSNIKIGDEGKALELLRDSYENAVDANIRYQFKSSVDLNL